jgi:hypothetical protein
MDKIFTKRFYEVGFEPPKYKSIMSELVDESKIILYRNGIINSNMNLSNLDWEYYQVSKLYQ